MHYLHNPPFKCLDLLVVMTQIIGKESDASFLDGCINFLPLEQHSRELGDVDHIGPKHCAGGGLGQLNSQILLVILY